MNINWVFADNLILDPMADVKAMKEVGPMWGSWRTWRACQTDNVICHELEKSQELIKRNFHTISNFYIPNENFITLDRPDHVKLYEGKFIETTINQDEIVAMHLAAGASEIILLLGFDWQEKPKTGNKLVDHQTHVYNTLIKHAITGNPEVQWVLIDHPEPIMKSLSNLDNLVKDTMSSALELKSI